MGTFNKISAIPAFDEGREARHAGAAKSLNPYAKGQDKVVWDMGYEYEEQEERDEHQPRCEP